MTVYDTPQGKTQLERCVEEARALGFETVAELDLNAFQVSAQMEERCKSQQCDSCDQRWGYPPELSSFRTRQEILERCTAGVLLQSRAHSAACDSDMLRQLHRSRFIALCDTMRHLGENLLPLGEGGCDLCDDCAYPAGCPTPERIQCCASAFGLSMSELCAANHIPDSNGENPLVLTSVLLFDWRKDPDVTLRRIGRCAIAGKVGDLIRLIHQALDEKIPPQQIAMAMTEHFLTEETGYHPLEQDLSRLLQGARSISRGMEVLRPYLDVESEFYRYTAIVGTASGDLHDLGKNLVAMMLEAAGFQVVDLGIDISAEDFARAVSQDDSIRLVGVSCLLTTSLSSVEKIVQKLNRHPRRKYFKVTVGGGATNEAFAARVGADAYTRSAVDAGEYARTLLKELRQTQP